jgi:hypothetical protein
LQLISERSGAPGETEVEENAITVVDLADDLTDVIMEYQVSAHIIRTRTERSIRSPQLSQQNAIHKQNRKLIVSHGIHVSRNDWTLIDLLERR